MLGAWYRSHVHQLRAIGAVVFGAVVQVMQAGPDVVLTWTWQRWLMGIAVAVGPGLLLLMRAGEFNASGAPPSAPTA